MGKPTSGSRLRLPACRSRPRAGGPQPRHRRSTPDAGPACGSPVRASTWQPPEMPTGDASARPLGPPHLRLRPHRACNRCRHASKRPGLTLARLMARWDQRRVMPCVGINVPRAGYRRARCANVGRLAPAMSQGGARLCMPRLPGISQNRMLSTDRELLTTMPAPPGVP